MRNLISICVIILLFQQSVCIPAIFKTVYEFVAITSNAIKLGQNVVKALEKSKNWEEVWKNMDSTSMHQEKVEEKLGEIQINVAEIKETIGKIKFSSDLHFFETNVKIPTSHVFNAFEKYFNIPNHYTKKGLAKQCHIHPPNSILQTLADKLSDDWLIEQAKFYKYQSESFSSILQKVDNIVKSLVFAQSACSGLHDLEEAFYDFKILKQNLKQIKEEIFIAKQNVHNYAFNYTKIYVKNFLSTYSKRGKANGDINAEIAKQLLHSLATKYNYGNLYTVFVSQQKTFKFFENFPETTGYNLHSSGTTVFVLRATSVCDGTIEGNLPGCLTNDQLKQNFVAKCATNVSCAVTTNFCACDFWYYSPGTDMEAPVDSEGCNDVFATNGGICRLQYHRSTQYIYKRAVAENFTTQTLAPRNEVLINACRLNITDDKKKED